MNPRIRRHGRTETKNGNAGFLGSNNETPPSTKQKRKARSVPFPNVDGVKNTDGLPAPKSRTMHASKDPTSSPNPTKQVPAGNRDKLVEQQDQLLFTESAVMDYVTLKGIENRFGIKKDDIPVGIFKELIDNSLDRVETIALTLGNHGFNPEIFVEIASYDDRIKLRVSNPDIAPNFTSERIHRIFDFYEFSSTKRNQYKVSRGALGNGLKAVLGMSYALATENYNYDGWTPLKIATGSKLYSITLKVDKINRKGRPLSAEIKTDRRNADENISVEINIPMGSNSESRSINELLRAFRNFTILNPHITMNITINGKVRSFPRVQKIKSDWNNLDSIHHYSYKEFENLILSSGANNMTLYDFVSSNTIRLAESSKLKKKPWSIPIKEVYSDRTIIQKFYDKLKKLAGPKEKLDLPYDMRIKPRKEAIIKRLGQWGIEVESVKYQSYNGPSNPNSANGDVKVPYFFDAAEIKTVNHVTGYEVISGINSTIAKLETMENPNEFKWTSKGIRWRGPLINTILREDCGYSDDEKKFRKSGSIVCMHLVSPRIDWEGYGKARIDFGLFDNLGDIIYNTCKGGIKQSGPKKVTQTGILTAYLKRRLKAIQQNPKLLVTDRLTPSDVWYDNRPELLKNRINISKNTRRNFTASIRIICEDLNINMEELGIFAADRAQLYFDGHPYDVGFDDLYSLKLKGTDLEIIEKEGIAEAFAPYADKKGVALLFTRGFATKYVRDLSELSANAGCNVSVLSDYDDSGILLASKLKVPRLGIDPKTLEYFNLKREDVEESYTPKSHLNAIKDLVSDEEYEYLSRKRIEINSVKTKVGTEKLWEWIIYRLSEVFPNRNYNRAIDVPKVVVPDDLKATYAKIAKGIERRLVGKCSKTKAELTNYKGFVHDVPQKRIEIEEGLKNEIVSDPDYKDLIYRLNHIVDTHPFSRGGKSN